MRGLLRRLIRFGLVAGWRRGVVGGSRRWVVIGGAALVAHLARRALGRKETVVFKERLEPGQSFVVTHEPEH